MLAVKPHATSLTLAQCLNIGMNETPHDHALVALRDLIDATGLGRVALKAQVSKEYLRQLYKNYPLKSGKPRSIGRDLADKLTSAFPTWMDRQHAPAGDQRPKGEVAHLLSQPIASYSPQFTWEAFMGLVDVPPTFRVAMPDDSMLPRVRRGDILEFDSREVARTGDGVLVRDGQGNLYFRLFRQAKPGQWEAHPVHPDYLPLHSDRDQLTVVGVMVGAPKHRWA